LNKALKPSDEAKAEILLAGLGPEFEVTLVGLNVSSTATFEDNISKA
jgi:hypothetical protein